ncbi:hypothetical protein LJY25_10525 [Hymenobacter sp. BT175]|uniref:hypothetical protein n=1 Tax=Hymenobacter translucens TaxID=2886507 RepID=UPI001D0EA272|nr:hypothetical protein [Hymenobacter translucens]MCC2546879.1 hypothetical protein [Hymenobacter translucens]
MTSLKLLLTAAAFALVLPACEKDCAKPTPVDTMVFGWFHGYCLGESCIDIFRIDKAAGQLHEDIKDGYPSPDAAYNGDYQLAKTLGQYQVVAGLPGQVPAQLLSHSNGYIGQPDFTDGGGYYVEIQDNGQRRFWLIDTQKANIPSYLHPFVDELEAKIRSLQ